MKEGKHTVANLYFCTIFKQHELCLLVLYLRIYVVCLDCSTNKITFLMRHFLAFSMQRIHSDIFQWSHMKQTMCDRCDHLTLWWWCWCIVMMISVWWGLIKRTSVRLSHQRLHSTALGVAWSAHSSPFCILDFNVLPYCITFVFQWSANIFV